MYTVDSRYIIDFPNYKFPYLQLVTYIDAAKTASTLATTNSKPSKELDAVPRKVNKDVRPWTETETERLLTSIEAYR